MDGTGGWGMIALMRATLLASFNTVLRVLRSILTSRSSLSVYLPSTHRQLTFIPQQPLIAHRAGGWMPAKPTSTYIRVESER